MDDIGPDNIDANQDPQMTAPDISPIVLSLEAAAILGMCATVVIGNGLVCVLGYRRPSQSGFSLANTILLCLAVVSVFTALLTMPLMVATILVFRWRYGDALCRCTGTLTFAFLVIACLIVFLIFVKRCSYLLYTEYEAKDKKKHWLLFVFVFLVCSILGLLFLINWRLFFENPTRHFCRLANSPANTAYRLFYGLFSVLLSVIVMILLTQPRIKHKTLG